MVYLIHVTILLLALHFSMVPSYIPSDNSKTTFRQTTCLGSINLLDNSMTNPSDCASADTRDDVNTLGHTAVSGSVASMSSWISSKVLSSKFPSVGGKIGKSMGSPIVSIQERKPLYGKSKHAIIRLKKDGVSLCFMPASMQDSRPFVLAAVRQNGLALEYASPSMQDDVKVVMAAVSQNGLALEHASSNIRNNESIAMVAVAQNGEALQFASQLLRGDKEIVLAAVQNDGMALQYASSEMRNDVEVADTAVWQNKNAVKYLGHLYLAMFSLSEIMMRAKNRVGGDFVNDTRSI
ncbi:hypothetical protein ACHAW6_003859 [Cyclotella cf. meneghiniana]